MKRTFIFLSACLVGLVAIRFALYNEYLVFNGDLGSYLMTRNWVLGQDPMGPTTPHFRPPLIGILLLPFTAFWGDLNGSKVLSLLLSVVPALPMYFFARLYVRPWLTVAAALALVLYPQNALNTALNQITLPASALAIWGLYIMARLQKGQGKTWHLLPPVFLLVGLNQTLSGVFAIMALTFFLCLPSRHLARALGLAFGASLLWLWFYIPVLPVANGLFLPGATGVIIPQYSTLLFFLPVFLMALLEPKKLYPWWPIALVLSLLAQIVIPEEALNNVFSRGMRVVPIFTILAFAILVEHYWDWLWKRARLKLALSPALILLVIGGNIFWFREFNRLASFYTFVTPDSLAGLNWLRDNTSADAKILAYPEALGWYVGGMVPRKWEGIPGRGPTLKAYTEGNDAFVTSMVSSPAALLARDIDFLVIDRSSWQSFNGPGWDNLDILPWFRKEAQFGSVGVYRLEAR